MTSLVDKQNEEKCPICFEDFRTPRKLSGCSHSFCETCIFTFVSDLKKEDKLGSEFECPVCRLPTQAPGNDDVLNRWVSSLETNEEVNCKVSEDSQDRSGEYCGQCDYLEKTVEAVKYCMTCQEFYCSACSDMVHIFKVNRNHAIVDIANKNSGQLHTQALKMLKGFIMCSEHPEAPVMIYCVDDKKLCCVSCSVSSHRNCKNVKSIGDLKQPVLDSDKLVDLTVNLRKHIKGIITTVRAYDAKSKEQLDKIEVEFQEIKQKVIKLLDVMEDNLKQEAKAAAKDIAIKREDEVDLLSSMSNTLDTVHYLFENFLAGMSSQQTFACIHGAERIVDDMEMTLVQKGDNIETESISLTTTEIIEQLLKLGPNETSQLASVCRANADIAIAKYEDRPFLRKYELKKIGIHKILPKKTEQPTYGELHFVHDNKILLVDSYYGFCFLLNEDFTPSKPFFHLAGKFDPKNSFSNERHATFFKDGAIAISIPAHKKITFVTAGENFEVRGEIMCEHKPKALHGLENGDLAISWDEPVAFGIISYQVWNNSGKIHYATGGKRQQTLQYCEKVYFTEDQSGRKLESFEFMAVDEIRHHVIQPCNIGQAVYCFDFDGKPIFCYMNDELEYPRGVAIDGGGNVYVGDSDSGCVHIISSEGLPIFIITENLPSEPLAVGFNKSNGTLAVTENSIEYGDEDSVHLFSVAPKLCQHSDTVSDKQ